MFRICIAASFSALALLAQGNPSGSIRGSVIDDKSRSMSGVLVTAQRDGAPAFRRSTTSTADGSFNLQGMPAGTYSLCAQVPAGGYLDPCQWSLKVPTLTLANRQASTGNVITIRKGGTVKIRMQDSGNQLGQRTRDGRQPHLLLGVQTPRGPIATARPTAKDNSGADFELTVPLGTRMSLLLSSRDLRLGNDLGSPLPNNNARDTFQQDSDAVPRNFSYTVIGQLP